MPCFFIDYENVGSKMEGLSLLNLTANDELVFFYSMGFSRMSMELHTELEGIRAKKLYIKADIGTRNALDFQLVSYLGACIQKYPEKEYCIVSKDGGYDCVCNFWRKRNIDVKRIERICYYPRYLTGSV